MESNNKNGNIFYTLIKIGFLKQFTYKEALIFRFISIVFFLMCQFFLWQSIFNSNNISNYSLNYMMSYLIVSQILTNFYPNSAANEISKLISQGNITYTLLKPIEFWKLILFENIGVSLFRGVVFSLPLLVFFFFYSYSYVTVISFVSSIIVILLSYLFFYFFELTIGTLAFFTMSTWGINSFKLALLSLLTGKLLPVSMFPSWLKTIIEFLPFKILYDTPISIILGKDQLTLTTVFTLLISIAIQYMIWKMIFNYGLKKIVIQGG